MPNCYRYSPLFEYAFWYLINMTNATRKYFSETSIGLASSRCIMIPPEEILSGKDVTESQKTVLDACHIYLICRRPRISFDKDKFVSSKGISYGILLRNINGKREEYAFSSVLINDDGGPISVAPYPHRDLYGCDKMGIVTRKWPATLIPSISNVPSSLRDFEVLYVGQAFGDGTRTALKRLQQHQTLQKILAETHATKPDDEIMIFMFEYPSPKIHVFMDGIGNDAEISGDEDIDHVLNVINNPPTEREVISMSEAGLIWYFKPEYNVKLKTSKPSSELKLLESCYKYDIAGMTVEINTEELGCRLWSYQRLPGYHHVAQFDLHDPQTRRSFFSLVDGNGDLTMLDVSGPRF